MTTPHQTQIKLCGMTQAKDAQLAVTAGADYIGLIFVPETPRCITLEAAQHIVQAVNKQAKIVGVFQRQSLEAIREVCSQVDLDMIQLHGDESPGFCKQLPLPVIKTLILHDEFSPKDALAYKGCHAVLLDVPKYWDKPAHKRPGVPDFPALPKEIHTLLAGQLTPESVGGVVRHYRPGGVDVASGIEDSPGRKNAEKMASFCRAVRDADAYINQQQESSSCKR
ncbi:MAG: phosphoribosylanthranilate isomerase [Vampirovibrio sp.]|nr:phosphoribosylanthranilate isomerase [Vampirovibrio sp.]